MPQVKIGWRSGSVAAPSVSTILLDAYSGAAAAYSLRKLSSTYIGSAIRVRRSSDNTELNIGFDANGDLDTVALSTFVGSGSGFVTTWYDQSGNSRDAFQTTAGNQPIIVSSGIIINLNNKSSIYFNGSSFMNTIQNVVSVGSGGYSVFGLGRPEGSPNCLFYIGNSSQNNGIGLNNNNGTPRHYWSANDYDSGQTFVNTNSIFVISYDGTKRYTTINNVTTSANSSGKNTTNPTLSIGRLPGYGQNLVGYESELVIYDLNKESIRTNITNDINSYYSIYPNPTSVWNLLAAAYNADSIGSSSLKTSLFAAYNGESNTNDSFGTNNGTAVGGLTYTTGKIGNAFNFNGSNSYIHLPENSIRFTNSFSTSFWLKTTVNQTGGGGLISDYYWGSEDWGYIIRLRTDNKISVFWRKDSTFNSVVSSSAISLNQWNHVSVVWDKVNTNWKIYINGVLDNQLTSVNASNITYAVGSNRTNIGSINSYGPDCLNGSMDSINFWNKILTQSEITELYNSGNGAQYITDNFYKPTPNDALNTYNGTAQGGLTYGVGKVGTAFQFNGTNSVVELPTNSMKFTGDFSYSFWVNFASLGGYPTLISNYRNAGGDYGYFIRMNPSNKLEVWGYATSTTSFSLASVTTFNTNTWYHVSVTKSASSVKIYVNGALERTASVGVPMTYFSTMYPAVGALYNWNGSSSVDFVSNGSKIDAVGIWNKELTQSEITSLYNSGNGKQYPF